MKDNNVIQLIQSSGLERVKNNLISLTMDSVRLWTEVEEERNIDKSHSKIGGRPDLPKSTSWPQINGRPLHFIAQINLEHVDFDMPHFPRNGLLSFFYDALEQPWGFDPKDRGSWKVVYLKEIGDLERKIEPAEIVEQGTFTTSRISFSKQTTLPSWESLCIQRLELNDEEQDLYLNLYEKLQEYNNSTGLTHRLLGHPDTIQGEMQLECQLVTNGLYCGDSSGYEDPKRTVLEPGADSWRLLLQIDSEEDIGMMWGDVGRIYFWILEDDLIKMNFNNVWVVLQCG
jgi:uncharacterized protein YwqG